MFQFTVPAGHKPGKCVMPKGSYRCQGVAAFKGTESGSTYLAATDGKILAVLPLSDPGPDKPLILPPEAVNANGKDVRIEVNGEIRSVQGAGIKAKTALFARLPQEGQWPNLRLVFPDTAKAIEGYSVLSLDAKQLATLAAALSPTGKVTLLVPPCEPGKQIEKPLVAIGVNEDGDGTGIGLIMPPSHPTQVVDRRRAYYAAQVANVPDESFRFPEQPF